METIHPDLQQKLDIIASEVTKRITSAEGEVVGVQKFIRDSVDELLSPDDPRSECMDYVVSKIQLIARKFYKITKKIRVDALNNTENPEILDLELGIVARRSLLRLGINSISQLTEKTADELLSVHNFGPSHLEEVRSELSRIGKKLKGE